MYKLGEVWYHRRSLQGTRIDCKHHEGKKGPYTNGFNIEVVIKCSSQTGSSYQWRPDTSALLSIESREQPRVLILVVVLPQLQYLVGCCRFLAIQSLAGRLESTKSLPTVQSLERSSQWCKANPQGHHCLESVVISFTIYRLPR